MAVSESERASVDMITCQGIVNRLIGPKKMPAPFVRSVTRSNVFLLDKNEVL
jgi:hypothetical protein